MSEENTRNQSENKGESANREDHTQLIRHVIQLASFLIYPGMFIMIFQSFRQIVEGIVKGTFSFPAYAAPVLTVIGILAVSILWGRFFCGYLCSFGAMGDLIYFFSEKVMPHPWVIPEKTDRYLRYIKYAVLAFLVIGVWILGVPLSSGCSPWNAFGALTSWNRRTILTAFGSLGAILLVLILVGSFFIERFFCRYLCPLGAIFSLASIKRLFKIRKKSGEENPCINCGLCSRKCSMGIPVDRKETVVSGECINCMKCVSSCPTGCLDKNAMPAALGTVVTVAGLMAAGNVLPGTFPAGNNHSGYSHSVEKDFMNPDQRETDPGKRGPGERNPGAGNNQDDGRRGQHRRGGHKDGKHFGNHGHDSGLDMPGRDDRNNENNNNNDNNNNSNNNNGTDNNNNNETKPDNGSQDNQTRPGNGNQDNQAGSGLSDLDLSKVKDGTYTGSGMGFRGEIKVTVTVENHKITDIAINSKSDDDQFFNRASSTIIDSIIESQSLDVDTVSGATFSSKGILEAVKNALNSLLNR